MSFTITVNLTGLPNAQKRIIEIHSRLNNPRGGLEAAVHKVAEVFDRNYEDEGAKVGGWPQLAELTNAMRVYQGYEPEHPILIRYGALRAVAVEFFKDARAGQAMAHGDDYSDQVVSGSLKISGKKATLHLGGSYKVLNQTGHSNARTGPNPARPFWFVNRESVAAAADGVRTWIEDEVLR